MAYAEELRAELLELSHDLIQVGLQIQAHAEDPEGSHLKTRTSGRFEITRWPATGDNRTKRFMFPEFSAIDLLAKRYHTAFDQESRND